MVLLIVLIVAVFVGYKVGMDSGRQRVCVEQRAQLLAAAAEENEFYIRNDIHGLYTIQGHPQKFGLDFVTVRFDELQELIARARGSPRQTPGP